jgi:aldose 1-epimerase
LDGAGASKIFDHQIKIDAEKYLTRGDDGLVTGEIRDVNGSAFDFREGCSNLGERIKQVPPVGFDHCFCVPNWNGNMKQIARYENKFFCVPNWGIGMAT